MSNRQSDEPMDTSEPLDPCEAFFKMEDGLARAAGHIQLKKEFFEESAHLRHILEPIVTGESTEPMGPNVLIHLANMRRISRLSQYLTSQLKKDTMAHLEEVESKYLELQNANSEICHLQKEIKRCLEYSAGDEDLNLVTEEEFYTNAPKEVAEPEKTRDDEHARYLARLKWELEQRKQLVGSLSEQETRRSVLLSDIEGKEQRLRSLKPKIASLIKAAKPVQDILGVQPSASTSTEQRTLFGLLPHDLTVLYVQAEAYKDIVKDENIKISIVGTVEEAQKWLAQKRSLEEVDSEDENPESAPAPRTKRTVSSRLTAAKESLIQAHPVYLSLDIYCEEKVKVNLKFRHIPDIRTTVVRFRVSGNLPLEESICAEEIMFDELFPNDFGNTCLDPVGAAKLNQFKISVDSFARSLGKPYQFVQALTGSGDAQTGGVQLADVLQETIKRIRERVTVRKELAEHVKLLDGLRLTSFHSDLYPSKTTSELLNFDHISEDEYLAALPKEKETFSSSHVFYNAVVHHRPSRTKIQAAVSIPAGYPVQTPEFSLRINHSDVELTSENDSMVHHLEYFLNVDCLSDVNRPPEAKSLLVHQVLTLVSRSDVLCDYNAKLNNGSIRNAALYEEPTEKYSDHLPLIYSPDTEKFVFV